MQPTIVEHPSRLDRRLEGLRDHPTVGMPVRWYLRRREQVLYLVVGVWNTLFGYGVWALLQFLIGDRVHYLVVVLMAWPIAVLNAYFMHRVFVFRSRQPVIRELPRFSLVYVGTLLANLAVLPVAMAFLPFSVYLVQAAYACVVVVLSYTAHKYYSFGSTERTDVSIHDP